MLARARAGAHRWSGVERYLLCGAVMLRGDYKRHIHRAFRGVPTIVDPVPGEWGPRRG